MNTTEFDKKILFELDKDGRMSYSEIARNLNSTPQVIKYHFEQLMDRGIIKHFWAFIDYDKADYSFFWGYWFKFGGMTKEVEKEMYAFFKAHMYIPIVMRTDGYADCLIGIIARDVFHHNEVLQEVYAKYGQYITMSDIVVGLGFIKFPRTYLVGKSNIDEDSTQSGGTTEKIKLSELDRKILSLLQIDGRMEFAKIAKHLNISTSLAQKHYIKLVDTGVITKITYTINYHRAEMKLYRVLFKIMQFDKEKVQALYDFCAQHPNIINYVKIMGNWQLILDIEVNSRKDLRDLLRELKYEFQDIIAQIETNEVYEIDKFTQMAIEYPGLIK